MQQKTSTEKNIARTIALQTKLQQSYPLLLELVSSLTTCFFSSNL